MRGARGTAFICSGFQVTLYISRPRCHERDSRGQEWKRDELFSTEKGVMMHEEIESAYFYLVVCRVSLGFRNTETSASYQEAPRHAERSLHAKSGSRLGSMQTMLSSQPAPPSRRNISDQRVTCECFIRYVQVLSITCLRNTHV